jgi:enediyne polyketide synthase
LRKVEDSPRHRPWPEALLGPYLERRLEELLPNTPVSVAVEHGATGEEVLRRVLGTDATVRHRADGKPELTADGSVSVARTGGLTLAIAGNAPLGCDVEAVTPRPVEAWRGLLGAERFRLAELLARQEDFNTAATRVWTAIECLKKAGALTGAPLVFDAAHKDGWILLRSGSLLVATYLAQVRDESGATVLSVLGQG